MGLRLKVSARLVRRVLWSLLGLLLYAGAAAVFVSNEAPAPWAPPPGRRKITTGGPKKDLKKEFFLREARGETSGRPQGPHGLHFGRDFGTKMDEKSMPKRCQKHVGNDLEVELAKTYKMTPLKAFLLFLNSKYGL